MTPIEPHEGTAVLCCFDGDRREQIGELNTCADTSFVPTHPRRTSVGSDGSQPESTQLEATTVPLNWGPRSALIGDEGRGIIRRFVERVYVMGESTNGQKRLLLEPEAP